MSEPSTPPSTAGAFNLAFTMDATLPCGCPATMRLRTAFDSPITPGNLAANIDSFKGTALSWLRDRAATHRCGQPA